MAKRRKRIVHEADLSKKTDSAPEAWTHVDDWQLIMWLLAVPAFYSRLCMSRDPKDQVARQKYEKLREAMNRHSDFGWQFVAISKAPLSELLNGLRKLSDSAKSLSTFLGSVEERKELNTGERRSEQRGR